MGGYGSGRGIRWNRRRTKGFVEHYKVLDARRFPYRGMKNLPHTGVQCSSETMGFQIFQERLEVFSKEDHKIGYSVYFSLSEANYGNYRYWFICPNVSCSRRCRKLFEIERPEGISYFLCRQCLNLVYRSQNRIELDRIIDRKWKLIHSLGCDTTWIWNHERPKGMHRKTFERIRKEIECLDNEATRRIGALCVRPLSYSAPIKGR